jgi:Holliday junction resolvasome RuvABC endonuclease subunit
MKILALDPATKCGWAHSSGLSGVWDLSIKRDESAGMRLIRLRAELDKFLHVHRESNLGVDLVVYEAVRNMAPGGRGASVVQAMIQGVIVLWCEDHGINYRGYSPNQIKKQATGKGNASKDNVLAAACMRWPKLDIIDDNHADALWLLDLALEEV